MSEATRMTAERLAYLSRTIPEAAAVDASEAEELLAEVRALLDALDAAEADRDAARAEAAELRGKVDGYEAAFDAQHAEIERLTDEAARLRAVVVKLPVTADGVPITPWMRVWIAPPDGRVPYMKTAGYVHPKRINYAEYEQTPHEVGAKLSCVYSTLEAAAGAGGDAKGGAA